MQMTILDSSPETGTDTPPPSLVCLVDDDNTARRFLADILTDCGYAVEQFDGPASFMGAAKRLRPDLILLDVEMPLMNGFELCRILKKLDGLADVPVLFLSGLSRQEDKVAAFASGGVDYVTKPYHPEEVKVRIATHLELARLHRALRDQNRELAHLVQAQVKEISDSQIATIHAMAKLAESRDDDTGQHINRVQRLCRFLAERLLDSPEATGLDLEPDFATHLELASPLHDIGKVGIPDEIMLKRGKLDPEEFDIMKTHTLIGARTLEEVHRQYPHNVFIGMGIQVARSHHERWDGHGYPQGLAGADIPLAARIMTIVDVYDALRSERCYKQSLSCAETLDLIRAGVGSQFDPVLARLLLDRSEEFERLRASCG
jgi:putative two-component system response regulator